jgi:hypothetical protein
MSIISTVIYAASITGCAFLILLCDDGMKKDFYNNPYFDSWLLPGVAGFSVFPVINTMICIFLGLYVIDRVSKQRKRAAELEAMLADPDHPTNRWKRFIEDQYR